MSCVSLNSDLLFHLVMKFTLQTITINRVLFTPLDFDMHKSLTKQYSENSFKNLKIDFYMKYEIRQKY